jgi:uncharacterized protein YndB with AHSA1/START domain
MKGNSQGADELLIDAPAARVWSILEDTSLLPQWVPPVLELLEHDAREGVGSVRRCGVAFGSKRGYIVERCVEAVPERRLAHVVEDDSLGFGRYFADYGFALELEPRGDGGTLASCTSYYKPRGLVSRVLNALLMRRRFSATRQEILGGLKELAERREELAA